MSFNDILDLTAGVTADFDPEIAGTAAGFSGGDVHPAVRASHDAAASPLQARFINRDTGP